MRGGQTALNSEDLEEQRKAFLKKTVQKQATLRNVLGKQNGFGPLFGPLFEHFFDKIYIFLMLWLVGNLTQVATSRPCRARCI